MRLVTGSAATILAMLMLSTAHAAETKSFAADGDKLAIDEACAKRVDVVVDPSLSGRIAMTATADHPEEIEQLDVGDRNGVAHAGLRQGLDGCWPRQHDNSFHPTMMLAIRVPSTYPISISESGLGQYVLGQVGPLTLSASGMMSLVAEAVTGNARIEASGDATVELGRVDADHLATSYSGTGSLWVKAGTIRTLKVSDSGTAKVRIDPVVDTASLSLSGVGNITVGGVRGALSRASSGLGRIDVGGRPPGAVSDED